MKPAKLLGYVTLLDRQFLSNQTETETEKTNNIHRNNLHD